MQIIRGPINGAQKVCLYGVEGIGKSYLASRFPNPLFIDTEGSTKHMDVARLPNPSSWTMLLDQIQYCKNNPTVCSTLVVDTIDWAERLCIDHVISRAGKKSITHFGYGEGFIQLEEEIGRFLNKLTDLIEIGIHVVLVAHAKIVRIEEPNEVGTYDKWEMKLGNKTTARTAALVKEWADMVLFANYKVTVVNIDNQGAQKGKNKAQGGKRVMFTTHMPWWDAKNRHDLLPEIPLDWDEIKHIFPVMNTAAQTQTAPPVTKSTEIVTESTEILTEKPVNAPEPPKTEPASIIPKPLADLMKEKNVTVNEIQQVVAKRGYYPASTPIENYDPQFIDGVLVGAWGQVFAMIEDMRAEEIPF